MSVLTTTSRWFRGSLMAAAMVATGVLTVGATATPANAQAYYPYYSPYYGYYPQYSYYRPYYPYYPYAAPVAVNVGWGWGWYGGHWGWGWRGGHRGHR